MPGAAVGDGAQDGGLPARGRGRADPGTVTDGRVPHALLLEIFTNAGIGTMVTQDGLVRLGSRVFPAAQGIPPHEYANGDFGAPSASPSGAPDPEPSALTDTERVSPDRREDVPPTCWSAPSWPGRRRRVPPACSRATPHA